MTNIDIAVGALSDAWLGRIRVRPGQFSVTIDNDERISRAPFHVKHAQLR